MTVKIGINGFGRIGRLAFRRIFELQARGGQAGDIEVAAINDLTTPATLAYLLKYDSTHGTFRHDDGTPVDVKATEDSIIVDGKEYKVYAEKDANNIPWVKNDGVEFVLECTGFYTSAEKSQAHLNAGAKKVLISAPAKDETTPTVVFGVNHEILKASDNIVSAGSCTTNSMAAMVKLLNDKFGIKLGFMTTIHAYTGTTTVFVTHDQEEALAVADRIGVMNKGKIEQIAAPQDLYQRPATEYVATFIGLTNRLPGASNGDEAVVFGQRVPLLEGSAKGDSVAVLVRPENLTLTAAAQHDSHVGERARVEVIHFLGSLVRVDTVIASGEYQRWNKGEQLKVTVQLPASELPAGLAVGDEVVVAPRAVAALAC